GNYNNITHTQDPLFNLIDTDGLGTGISLIVTDPFWPGSNTGGTGAPGGDAAGIPASATADNLFGSLVSFGGFLEPTGGVTFGGLDASGATRYDFLFFASRMSVTDVRETQYDLTGANAGMALLDASNNTDNVAWIRGIQADANGEIVLNVTAGPNNTNSNGFYYLGYLQITTVPAPSSIAFFGLGSLAAVRRRR
ncbi:MAG: PEP-CTERM sorting domain-containing protein, partial [Planctomycetes bacterium]|nr:PEP-CTERM sorting domain-containing protein [Planctomycetota bacterium]